MQPFPGDGPPGRLTGAVPGDWNDEWIASGRRYMPRESMNRIGRVVALRDGIGGQTADLVPAPEDRARQRAGETCFQAGERAAAVPPQPAGDEGSQGPRDRCVP